LRLARVAVVDIVAKTQVHNQGKRIAILSYPLRKGQERKNANLSWAQALIVWNSLGHRSMSDALDLVTDPVLKAQLRKLRESEGSVLTSLNLRKELLGFGSQKGIYKPSGSPYALWVRQTLRGVYGDQPPVEHPDGSWTYRYAPEGRRDVADMSLATNQSLLKCLSDGVPVGVLLEKEIGVGRRAYEIRGLAFVESFDGTHFRLKGEPIDWDARPVPETTLPPFEPFDRNIPQPTQVSRKLRTQRFRWAISQAYHEKCSLCELGFKLRGETIGLEAAHVVPFQVGGTSRDVRNGILLCRNHHSLFDRYAWTFDEDYRVKIAEDKDLRSTALPNHILKLEGKRIPNLPDRRELCPDPIAIKFRMDKFTGFWE
jgi:hypothetical protein